MLFLSASLFDRSLSRERT